MTSNADQLESFILHVFRCACRQSRLDIAEFMLAALEKLDSGGRRNLRRNIVPCSMPTGRLQASTLRRNNRRASAIYRARSEDADWHSASGCGATIGNDDRPECPILDDLAGQCIELQIEDSDTSLN